MSSSINYDLLLKQVGLISPEKLKENKFQKKNDFDQKNNNQFGSQKQDQQQINSIKDKSQKQSFFQNKKFLNTNNQNFGLDNIQQQQIQNRQPLIENNQIINIPTINNLSNQNSFINQQAQPLLIMTIDLGEGNQAQLEIFEEDESLLLAKNFCKTYGLAEEAIEILKENIEQNKQIVLQERDNSQVIKRPQFIQKDNYNIYEGQGLSQPNSVRQGNCFNQISSENQSLFSEKNIQQNSENDCLSEQNLFSYKQNPNYEYEIEDTIQQIQQQQSQVNRKINETEQQKMNQLKQQIFQQFSSNPLNNYQQPLDINFNINIDQTKQEANYSTYDPKNQQYESNNYEKIGPNNNADGFSNISGTTRSHAKSTSRVFDRLHKDAQVKQLQLQKKQEEQSQNQSKRSVGNLSNKNVGDYLYQKGQKQREEQQLLIEKRKLELMQQQESELTFKPKISEKSVQIIEQKKYDQQQQSFQTKEQQLIQMGKQTIQKKEQQRSVQQIQQQLDCPFKPQINKISEHIMQEKLKQNPQKQNIFDVLYDEARIIQEKKQNMEQFDSNYSFHPTLIQSQLNINIDQTPFLERMEKDIQTKMQRKKQQNEQEPLEIIDEQTGQSMFHPQLYKPPRGVSSRRGNVPVYDYLYQQKDEKENIIKKLIEKEKDELVSQRAKSSMKSNEIYQKKLKSKMFEIFNQMDTDNDGLISAHNVEISNLETNILEKFAPILLNMEKLCISHTFETFCEEAEQILQEMNIQERNAIIYGNSEFNSKKKQVQSDQYTFQPTINKKSNQIAEIKRSYSGHLGIYKNDEKFVLSKEQKLKEEQDKLIQDQMKECSFKPQLYKPMNIYNFNSQQKQNQQSGATSFSQK